MADWVDITDSQVDPDAPLTSELAYAWRDNVIAMAEGALGAPRVAPAALRAMGVISISLTGAAWAAVSNLGPIKQIGFDVFLGVASNGATMQVSFSNDGGTSWGAAQNIAVMPANSGLGMYGVIDLQTGSYALTGQFVGGGAGGGNAGVAGTYTVPANVNAVRFNGGNGRVGTLIVTLMGGRV